MHDSYEPIPSTNGSPSAGPQLRRDAWGRLAFTDAGGKEHMGVSILRAFPLTDPSHGIAICDAHGNELLWIDDIESVPPSFRQTLEDDLGRRHFMPVIVRIVNVSSPMEPSEWDVETDRGRTRFSLNSEEDVRKLTDRRAIVIDAHGVHYLIADVEQLDAASRRWLERYL